MDHDTQRLDPIAALPPLCTIGKAAIAMGVPKASLRHAAERHGHIVRMGRVILLERDLLLDLVKKCRDQPKVPDSTNSNIARTGTSATQDAQTAARAAQAAQKLKRPSRRT